MTDAQPAGDRRLIAVIERMLKQVECLDEDAFLRRVNFALYADDDVVQRAAHALIDLGLHHLTIYAAGELSDRSPPTIHGCGRPPSTRWAPRWLATRSTRRTRPRSPAVGAISRRHPGSVTWPVPRRCRPAEQPDVQRLGYCDLLAQRACSRCAFARSLVPRSPPSRTPTRRPGRPARRPSPSSSGCSTPRRRPRGRPAPGGGAPQRPRPAARPNLLCARSVGLRPLPEQLVHRGRLLHDAVLDGVVAELGNRGGVDRHRPQRQPDLSPPPRRRRGSASRTPCSC